MYPHEARTAVGAAFIRAAHLQVGCAPYVVEDYLADALLERDEKSEFRDKFAAQYTSWLGRPWFRSLATDQTEDPFLGYMRTSPLVPEVLARQAYAESFVKGIDAKFRQYVILGAGLDTFSYRNGNSDIAVFEVDRKNVSDFKKRRATSLGTTLGRAPVSVPVDLGTEDLADRLRNAGLNRDSPTVATCLGLTPYLGANTILNIFLSLRSLMVTSSLVVFDYTLPDALSVSDGCPFTIELAKRLADLGEPLRLELDTEAYSSILGRAGFRLLEHLAPGDIQAKYFECRSDGLMAAKHVCLAAAIAA